MGWGGVSPSRVKGMGSGLSSHSAWVRGGVPADNNLSEFGGQKIDLVKCTSKYRRPLAPLGITSVAVG